MSKVYFIFSILLLMQGCNYFNKHETIEARYPNGQLKEKYEVIQDTLGNYVKDGQYTSWHENGMKQSAGEYVDGKINGEWIRWFQSGNLLSKSISKDGQFNGKYIVWYESGQKKEEGEYLFNNFVGLRIQWYENGQKEEESNYQDYQLVGNRTQWYQDGKFKLQENYSNGGKRNGQYYSWDENGDKKEGRYVDDILIGSEKKYNSNGILTEEIEYYPSGRIHFDRYIHSYGKNVFEYDEYGNIIASDFLYPNTK